jgi:hypothetical protein
MRTLVIAEAFYLLVIAAVFVAVYALRSPWSTSPIGRNVMAVTSGIAALLAALLATLVWDVPMWIFAVVVGELCIALTRRLWLLWEIQHHDDWPSK